MTKQEYEAKLNAARKCDNPTTMHILIIAASVEYITFIEAENDRLNHVNANSVSKMELYTCRSLNDALREENVRLRKELRILLNKMDV